MLEIRNLSKAYDNGVQALDDINLSIGKGMFGLLGPNGAGKSTFMRTLAMLQLPDEGEITFDGINVLRQPMALKQVLGYLPQEFGVYPRISAFELLNYLAVLKGLLDKKSRQKHVCALLEQTNLYEQRNNAVSTFSGGMKRRFGIAQALLGNPKLIMVDEPTAGLDPEERNRFYNLLSQVSEDIVLILSTHIIEDIQELCIDMAIISNGQLLNQGSPRSLIAELDNKIWHKQTQTSEIEALQQNYKVISTRTLGNSQTIRIYLDKQPEPGFEQVSPTLEDAYFSSLKGFISQEKISLSTRD